MTATLELYHQSYKGKTWVARINGTDDQYGYDRTFLDADTDGRSRSGKTGWMTWELEDGLYEVNEPAGDGRYFARVHEGVLTEVTAQQLGGYLAARTRAANTETEAEAVEAPQAPAISPIQANDAIIAADVAHRRAEKADDDAGKRAALDERNAHLRVYLTARPENTRRVRREYGLTDEDMDTITEGRR